MEDHQRQDDQSYRLTREKDVCHSEMTGGWPVPSGEHTSDFRDPLFERGVLLAGVHANDFAFRQHMPRHRSDDRVTVGG